MNEVWIIVENLKLWILVLEFEIVKKMLEIVGIEVEMVN